MLNWNTNPNIWPSIWPGSSISTRNQLRNHPSLLLRIILFTQSSCIMSKWCNRGKIRIMRREWLTLKPKEEDFLSFTVSIALRTDASAENLLSAGSIPHPLLELWTSATLSTSRLRKSYSASLTGTHPVGNHARQFIKHRSHRKDHKQARNYSELTVKIRVRTNAWSGSERSIGTTQRFTKTWIILRSLMIRRNCCKSWEKSIVDHLKTLWQYL